MNPVAASSTTSKREEVSHEHHSLYQYVGFRRLDPGHHALFGGLGAVEAGHQAEIVLLGEATYLMKDYIVEQIDGVGWPPLQELLPQVIDHGIPIHV